MKHKFNEVELLKEIRDYIDSTYGGHYHYTSDDEDQVQMFELINRVPERGVYFALGNCIKYSDRFGQKDGMNRRDILKTIHYGIMALYSLDKIKESKE